MSTASLLVSLDEYLTTDYDPDVEYADGVLVSHREQCPGRGQLAGSARSCPADQCGESRASLRPVGRLPTCVVFRRRPTSVQRILTCYFSCAEVFFSGVAAVLASACKACAASPTLF